MSILNSGLEFLEARGFNTTHIVDIMSAKVWWWINEDNQEVLPNTQWITYFYLILLALLLYGLWWMIFVPINWIRVCVLVIYSINSKTIFHESFSNDKFINLLI